MSTTGIEQLIRENRLAEAASELDALIAADCADAMTWYLRGKVWWKTGDRAKAKNCYLRSLSLDSESPARYALNHAFDIEQFFNPDLLNP